MENGCTIAVVSDTHGYLDARIAEAVCACDMVVHAGDIGGARVLDALQPRGGRIVAVLGNNDEPAKWPAADRARIHTLPDVAEVALPGGMLVVVHGDRVLPAKQRHDRLRSMFPAARAIVYGHSHRLSVDRSAQPWVLNPGAAGRARTYGGPSCVILRAAQDEWDVRPLRFAGTLKRGIGAS